MPLMAMLLASVAPEVKTISLGSAPIKFATCSASFRQTPPSRSGCSDVMQCLCQSSGPVTNSSLTNSRAGSAILYLYVPGRGPATLQQAKTSCSSQLSLRQLV